jgi:hypothetical protein
MSTALLTPVTAVGMSRVVVVPSPIVPSPFEPQHIAAPDANVAHV